MTDTRIYFTVTCIYLVMLIVQFINTTFALQSKNQQYILLTYIFFLVSTIIDKILRVERYGLVFDILCYISISSSIIFAIMYVQNLIDIHAFKYFCYAFYIYIISITVVLSILRMFTENRQLYNILVLIFAGISLPTTITIKWVFHKKIPPINRLLLVSAVFSILTYIAILINYNTVILTLGLMISWIIVEIILFYSRQKFISQSQTEPAVNNEYNEIIGSLSPREKDVFDLLLDEDNSSKFIANKLNISARTVDTHVNVILKKFNLKRRRDLKKLFNVN